MHVVSSLPMLMFFLAAFGFLSRGFLELESEAEMLVGESARFSDFFLLPTESEVAGSDAEGRTAATFEETDMVGM